MTISASRFLNELWLQRTVKEFVTACIRSMTDYAFPPGETGRSDYDAKRHVQHWHLRILTLEEHHNQLCNTLFSNILSDPIHKIRNQLPARCLKGNNWSKQRIFLWFFKKRLFFFPQEETNRARNSINAMVSDNNFCAFLCFRKFNNFSNAITFFKVFVNICNYSLIIHELSTAISPRRRNPEEAP